MKNNRLQLTGLLLGTFLLEEGDCTPFRLPDGMAFYIDIQPGCPECPARVKVVELPNV